MSEKTGIIRNVGIGMRDTPWPCLWFDVYISESEAALQILSLISDGMEGGDGPGLEVLRQVNEIRELEGRPCIVEVSPGAIQFVRLWQK